MEQTPITTPEILQVDSINGLEISTREAIQKAFLPFAEQFAEWKEKAKEIVVTDISETDKMKAAGEARKAIKKIRTGADAVRKSLKEDSLKYGKAVQEVYNKIESEATPIEEHLEKQEKFKELEEARQRQILIAERMDLLKDFPNVTSEMVINLDEDNFQVFLSGLLDQKSKREEAERKEQEEAAERLRIVELTRERRSGLMEKGLWVYLDAEDQVQNFGAMPEEDFKAYIDKAEILRAEEAKRRAEVEAENERLRKEAEEKQKRNEIRNGELRPYIVFIRDYNTLVNMEESEYQKEFSEIKKGAELQWEQDRKEAAMAAAREAQLISDRIRRFDECSAFLTRNGFTVNEQGATFDKKRLWFIGSKHFDSFDTDRELQDFLLDTGKRLDEIEKQEKLEAENKRIAEELAKREADDAKAKAQEEAEKAAQLAEMKRIAIAGDKEKLEHWLNTFTAGQTPTLSKDESLESANQINHKFQAFKVWAAEQISKL